MLVGAVVPVKDENSLEVCTLQRELKDFADKVWVIEHGTLGEAYEAGNNVMLDHWWSVHVDLGHDPNDVRRLVDAAADLEGDVTIGSRFVAGGGFVGPWYRQARSVVASWMMNVIAPHVVADWTSGMRVYSPRARKVLREHAFRTSGHAWQIESLWVCLDAGLRIHEVPITYTAGHSHMSAGRAWEAARLWGHLASARSF